jgi:putative aldouronate transport system substrate-binding protein
MKRILSLVSVLILSLAVFVGCAAPTATPTLGPTATPTPDLNNVTLPLVDTLTVYKAMMSINESAQDYKNSPVWDAIPGLTNVKLEFTSILNTNYATEFNLMLAAKTYPDIFSYPTGAGAASYPGGLEQAVDDGIILDLKPMLEANAPLYWSMLNKPENLRDCVTDKGYIPAVYQIKTLKDDKPATVWGMMIRKDWLDKDGLAMPTTIDEWHTVLTTFKEKNGATYPLLKHLGDNPVFMQAYGVITNPANQFGSGVKLFYPDKDGKIRYGGTEQAYADYLKTLSQWYAEGLYDRDFDTRFIYDLPGEAALVGQGKAGATGGFWGWSGMFYGASTEQTGFNWVAAPAPKLTATSELPGMQIDVPKYLSDPWVITKAAKNPELLLKLFNWMCTDAGSLLMNYGVAGDSYTMVSSKPTFTDKILKNDKGAEPFWEIYTGNFQPNKLVFSKEIIDQMNTPTDLAQQEVFSSSVNPIYITYSLNAEEATQVGNIMSDIQTYILEQYVLAVKDPAVAAKWMDVQAKQIQSMGIADAIAICQTAYDRYMAKK